MSVLTVQPSARLADTALLSIDPRSYQVFEFRGDRLLFDRATGTTSELGGLAYELLKLCKEMPVEQALERLSESYDGVDINELREALRALKNRGFFIYKPIDVQKQEQMLDVLWNHKPRRIQLLMAQGCNLGCRYCYAWRNGSNQKSTLMPFKVARTAVDYLVWRSGNRPELQITFFGGEPLLNYDVLRKVVRYCRRIEKLGRKKFTFELITNGTLLSPAVVDFVVKQKFLLFISIDGWKEMHNYNRPTLDKSDIYDTIIQNAQYANEQYKKHKLPPIKARANLTNKYHDSEAVGKYLESLGFSCIGVGAIETLSHQDSSPSAMTEDQLDEMHQQTTDVLLDGLEKMKRKEKLGVYLSQQMNRTLKQLEPQDLMGITCGIGRNTLVVDNKGSVFPCHRYEGMDAYKLGDVFTGLNRELTMKYYRKVNGHSVESCSDCWIRDLCRGGCAWLLTDKAGEIHDPTERECNRRRASVERGLWFRKEARKHFPQKFNDSVDYDIEKWDWDLNPAPTRMNISLKVLGNAPSKTCGSGCTS